MLMLKWRAFGAGLAATLILGIAWAQVSSVGGLPARPRFSAVGIGATAPATAGDLTATGTISSTLGLRVTGATRGIEHGAVGTANSPYVDFHSSSSITDFDVRLISSGGTAVDGAGTLGITAAQVQLNGVPILKYAGGLFQSDCTNDAQTTNYGITSCTRTSAGRYTVNYTAAGFSAPPVCQVTDATAGSRHVGWDTAATATTMFVTSNAAADGFTATDAHFSIYCVGT